jgi:hypothetical protein
VLIAETPVLCSASGLGCLLVVGIAQAVPWLSGVPLNFKLNVNGTMPALIIFYQRRLHIGLFWILHLRLVACWLRRFLQVDKCKV